MAASPDRRTNRQGLDGPPREACSASRTFSDAGSPSKSAYVWNDRASPRRALRVAER